MSILGRSARLNVVFQSAKTIWCVLLRVWRVSSYQFSVFAMLFASGWGYSSYLETQKLLGATSRPLYGEHSDLQLIQALQRGLRLVSPFLEAVGVSNPEAESGARVNAIVSSAVRQFQEW